MKTMNLLLKFLFLFLILISCNNEETDSLPELKSPQNPAAFNKKGIVDGVSYSYNNVVLNPNVVGLTNENATLVSSKEEISQGIIKLSGLASEISGHLATGKIVYIQIDGYTDIRKIESIHMGDTDICILNTTQSGLEELFEEGSIDISFDINETLKTYAENGYSHLTELNILNLFDEYDLGNGLTFSPNTELKMIFSANIEFKKISFFTKISKLTSVFELHSNFVPSMNFVNATNTDYSFDLVDYIPQSVIELLKKQHFEYEIPIPNDILLIGGMSIPVGLKIADIHIPTYIEANLSKKTDLSFGFEGRLKMGYTYDASANKTYSIFENSLKAVNPTNIDIDGELLSNMSIDIIPEISIVSTQINAIKGNISLGINTLTASSYDVSNGFTSGSTGTFNPQMGVEIDLILAKPSFNLPLPSSELWNNGVFNKRLSINKVEGNVTNSYKTNLTNREYATNFTFYYEYPDFPLKKISPEIEISYDIYASNNSLLQSKQKTSLKLKKEDITNREFKITFDIPFRRTKLIPLTYDSNSIIRNIVITDKNGYECMVEGEYILNR